MLQRHFFLVTLLVFLVGLEAGRLMSAHRDIAALGIDCHLTDYAGQISSAVSVNIRGDVADVDAPDVSEHYSNRSNGGAEIYYFRMDETEIAMGHNNPADGLRKNIKIDRRDGSIRIEQSYGDNPLLTGHCDVWRRQRQSLKIE